MKKYNSKLALLLISMSILFSQQAFAVSHPYEFHADAGMTHEDLGPVAKTYGYMNVVTDPHGNGIISVMFSNGSQLQWMRFNARVKFLDASGSIVREEYFEHRIGAAGFEGAIERKVTRSFDLADFDSIQVDFYLSDIPDTSAIGFLASQRTD